MRLVLVSDQKGVPVGYDLVDPKAGAERESVFRLATAHPESLLFCDGGFWGAEYESSMELIDVELITPERHKLGERPAVEVEKARIRLWPSSRAASGGFPPRGRDLARTPPGDA